MFSYADFRLKYIQLSRISDKSTTVCHVIGPFACHESLNRIGTWDISHIATGLVAVNSISTRVQAKRLALELVNDPSVCWNFGSGLGKEYKMPMAREEYAKVIVEAKKRMGL